MTTYEKGDVILVPFPFSNQTTIKKRPTVVISAAHHNNVSSDIIMMAIASQISKSHGIDECIIEDWNNAGLLKLSSIKAAISTIEQPLVLRKLGKLSHRDLTAINNFLNELLELKSE